MKISISDKIFLFVLAISLIFALFSGSGIILFSSLLVAGLVILIKGADYLVEGGSEIAEHYGISHMIIGLTIVAFGTSMPEFMVSVYASFVGSGGISIGNVVGSNIFNILMVLGVPAIAVPIAVNRKSSDFDSKFMILSGIILFILSFGMIIDNPSSGFTIGTIDGVILLLFFAYYLRKTLKDAKKQKDEHEEKRKEAGKGKMKMSIVLVALGIIGIGLGGQVLVDNGREIALYFGVPEIVIGLTLMALGTSLPEFAAGVVAACKKKPDIAIGNVVGSNIFNTLLVGGAAAVAKPIADISQNTIFIEIPFMIFVSVLLLVFMKTGNKITRREGLVFVILYAVFLGYLFF